MAQGKIGKIEMWRDFAWNKWILKDIFCFQINIITSSNII